MDDEEHRQIFVIKIWFNNLPQYGVSIFLGGEVNETNLYAGSAQFKLDASTLSGIFYLDMSKTWANAQSQNTTKQARR